MVEGAVNVAWKASSRSRTMEESGTLQLQQQEQLCATKVDAGFPSMGEQEMTTVSMEELKEFDGRVEFDETISVPLQQLKLGLDASQTISDSFEEEEAENESFQNEAEACESECSRGGEEETGHEVFRDEGERMEIECLRGEEASASRSPPSKGRVSLRAPMHHNEVNQMLRSLRDELKEDSESEEDAGSLNGMINGTAPIDAQRTKPSENTCGIDSSSGSSSQGDELQNSRQSSDQRERITPKEPMGINRDQEYLARRRIDQMKIRWEVVKKSLEPSENEASREDESARSRSSHEDSSSNDGDESSSECEESISSDDEKNKTPNFKQRWWGSAQSRGVKASLSRKLPSRGSSTGSSAPSDRRAAMMAARRPSGNRLTALLAFKEATKSVKDNMTVQENFNFKSMVRNGRKIDMETGATETRDFTATRVFEEEYFQPMNPIERRKKLFLKHRLHKKRPNTKVDKKTEGARFSRTGARRNLFAPSLDEPIYQYRLSSMIAQHDDTYFGNRFNIVREYLFWCFRNSFLRVVAFETVVFSAWCWGFAILYYGLVQLNPMCVRGPGGLDFEEGDMSIVDLFTLSWTTFATVGFGAIYPTVRGEGANDRCILLTCLISLQSFMGVLYGSFCSAVIFAKIAKYQSIAHVMFSNSVVIRFGQELMQDNDLFDYAGSDDPGSNMMFKSRRNGLKMPPRRRDANLFPCPIMEFRIVNLLLNEKGGEIMNCKLNVAASALEEVTKLDKKNDSNFFDSASRARNSKKLRKRIRQTSGQLMRRMGGPRTSIITTGELMRRGSIIQIANRTISSFSMSQSQYSTDGNTGENDAEGQPFKEGEDLATYYRTSDPFPDYGSEDDEDCLEGISESGRHPNRECPGSPSKSIFVDEEPCSAGGQAMSSRRVFSKVEIETDSHPFFKRVWNIRHVLNVKSPLLTEEARNEIKKNGGLWPATMCNPEAIKECLGVTQLIVSLSGTAAVSGSSIYKLHVYEKGFVEIGRTFENPLVRDPDGKLTIDVDKIHSTKPQFEEMCSDDEEEKRTEPEKPQNRKWPSIRHMKA